MFTRTSPALGPALTLLVVLVAPVAAQPNCPPDRPGNFSASDGTQCNGVALNWSDVDGATNYQVWRSRNSNMDNDVVIGNPDDSQLLDLTALPGITYYYRVRAFHALCIPGENFGSFSSINAGRRGDTPLTPTNLQASDGTGCFAIDLTWNGVPGGPLYEIWRNTSNDYADSILAGTSPIESLTDPTVLPGQTYYYWVRATALCGNSPPSNFNTGFRGLQPDDPTGLSASDDLCHRVQVRWNDPGAITLTEVWRNTSTDLNGATLVGAGVHDPGTTTFVFDDLTVLDGTDYYYWVRNRNQCGPSGYSARIRGSPGTTPPAVQNFDATEATRCDGVMLTWNPVVSSPAVTSYRILRSFTGDFADAVLIHVVSGTSYLDTDTDPGQHCFYWIAAFNNCGVGPVAAAAGTAGICAPPLGPTFTVSFPLLGTPPDEEGQGWYRPPVWAGHQDAADDSIEVPNGRPIYALFVSGYAQNANLDQLTFYHFARYLMAQGAYVHYAWWNNLLAPYMERPLHLGQAHPGTAMNFGDFTTPDDAAEKAVPGEDYQFVADAARLLRAIRANNPSAIIIVAGHSMGGGSVVHLASQVHDVAIDIVAPIDPVDNRNYPWAAPSYSQQSFYNWTRWRVTRHSFLGFSCGPSGPWFADIDEVAQCPQGVYFHDAPTLTFGSNVVNLFHRWQNEALFPFDFANTYTFGHTTPLGGTTSQAPVTTHDSGPDPGGWPLVNAGGACCPVGSGVAWDHDGHGEIVGFRGPGPTFPLGVRVRTSPFCTGCFGLTWPARTSFDGTWYDPDSSNRRAILRNLELLDAGDPWEHAPYNPDLCLVSSGMISLFNTMNKPPVAHAGPDQTVSCTGCQSADVTLSGAASTDPDHDGLQFTWTWDSGTASGEAVNINLPVGAHAITLEVEDPCGHISRDAVLVTVEDRAAAVVPYTSLATSWQAAAGEYEARAFDEFYPGVAAATRCLLQSPSTPAVLSLAGGTLTVSSFDGATPACAITDSSTTPAVSDAHVTNAQSTAVFAFNPPVTAFYTYYGSLATGRTATMTLYDQAGASVRSLTTPPSTHSSLAAGQGFTSTIPIARIEFSSDEPGGVLIGAFVGLRPGEQSLGTIDLGNYSGPGGSGVIELDFACTFACPADFNHDGAPNSQDFFDFLSAFFAGAPPADFNRDGAINSQDFFDFLTAFFTGC